MDGDKLRDIAKTAREALGDEFLRSLKKQMKAAARRGEMSIECQIPCVLFDVVRDRLTEMGLHSRARVFAEKKMSLEIDWAKERDPRGE